MGWQRRATGEGTRYTTADHLGTPRVITATNGVVVSRHDYQPFGEELFAGMGGRSTTQGYSNPADSLRQKFTGYERDSETGLDFALARYYANTQGRFTSPDPYNIILEMQAIAEINPDEAQAQFISYLSHPQRWNRYVYVANNPLKYVDPSGEDLELTGSDEDRARAFERIKQLVGSEAAQYLYVTETQDRSGNSHYFVQVDTSRVSDPLASYGGELGVFISDIISTTNVVEFRVATSFDTKYETNQQTGSLKYGGAATVGAEESLTGNTQIFVHSNAHAIAQDVLGQATVLGGTRSNDNRGLDFYNDIVDAHEFGHAYDNVIGGIPLRNSGASNNRALQLENYVRERRGLPNRRIRH